MSDIGQFGSHNARPNESNDGRTDPQNDESTAESDDTDECVYTVRQSRYDARKRGDIVNQQTTNLTPSCWLRQQSDGGIFLVLTAHNYPPRHVASTTTDTPPDTPPPSEYAHDSYPQRHTITGYTDTDTTY
jgi:hypothetical protein